VRLIEKELEAEDAGKNKRKGIEAGGAAAATSAAAAAKKPRVSN
jgi:hypothetical protein